MKMKLKNDIMKIAISRYRKIQIHWFTSIVKSCVIMF